MGARPHHQVRGPFHERSFPYLTGHGAHRLSELITLRLAPAVAASALAYTRVDSEWQALLVFLCFIGVTTLLRRHGGPMHLMPLASAFLYFLGPLLGAALACGISATDNYAISAVTPSEMVVPVIAAWIVTALGGWITIRLRRDRKVRVAVIGSHEFAKGLEAELEAVGISSYEVVGCVDPAKSCGSSRVAGVPCLGSLVLLRGTVLEHRLELLVLGPLDAGGDAAPSRLEAFEQVADACLDLPVFMIEAGQFYEEVFGHVPLGTTTSAWFQYLLHPRYRPTWSSSKRMLDLIVGSVAAVLSLPLLLLGALAIKLTDKGPVLHRQPRMGAGGQMMELVKLRTMRVDSDGPGWTGSEDERVSPVGRVLRRLHIDELPQLWLVLKGEMSLVGPRPEQPSIVNDLESRFTYYDRRHLVKPGITGWAQVRCGYSGSHIGSAWKLCHDLYYLKNRSLVFDLLIMVETLSAVAVPEPINRPDEQFIVAARAGREMQPTHLSPESA